MLSLCSLFMDVRAPPLAVKLELGIDFFFVLLLGPGCFLEVRKILPLLVAESSDHPSFHVVAVSLPGYGFSEAPKKKGFAMSQYAEVRLVFQNLPVLYGPVIYKRKL
jgi:hypothetical protein